MASRFAVLIECCESRLPNGGEGRVAVDAVAIHDLDLGFVPARQQTVDGRFHRLLKAGNGSRNALEAPAAVQPVANGPLKCRWAVDARELQGGYDAPRVPLREERDRAGQKIAANPPPPDRMSDHDVGPVGQTNPPGLGGVGRGDDVFLFVGVEPAKQPKAVEFERKIGEKPKLGAVQGDAVPPGRHPGPLSADDAAKGLMTRIHGLGIDGVVAIVDGGADRLKPDDVETLRLEKMGGMHDRYPELPLAQWLAISRRLPVYWLAFRHPAASASCTVQNHLSPSVALIRVRL